MPISLSPALVPAIVTTLALPGYCNHVHELHDGQTRWLLVDIEEYRTKRSTVQLYRLNYYKEPDECELCWDLTRDEEWNPDHKPGAGHSVTFNPISKNLIVSISWKGIGDADGTSGATTFVFVRDQIPQMQG